MQCCAVNRLYPSTDSPTPHRCIAEAAHNLGSWGAGGAMQRWRAAHGRDRVASRRTCRSRVPPGWTPLPQCRSDCLRTPAQAPTPLSSGTGPPARLQTLSRDGASAGCPIMHWAILIRARCPITLSPVSLSRKTVYISTHHTPPVLSGRIVGYDRHMQIKVTYFVIVLEIYLKKEINLYVISSVIYFKKSSETF